ncbi:hypothetical protein Tco_0500526 [Tanacetum coccineum]
MVGWRWWCDEVMVVRRCGGGAAEVIDGGDDIGVVDVVVVAWWCCRGRRWCGEGRRQWPDVGQKKVTMVEMVNQGRSGPVERVVVVGCGWPEAAPVAGKYAEEEFVIENEDEEKTNNGTFLMVQSLIKVTLDSSYFSDNASSLDDDAMQNEYNNLCEISLKIINKNKILKTKRELLENEILELKEKIKRLERNKAIDIECESCQELHLENDKLKESQAKLVNDTSMRTLYFNLYVSIVGGANHKFIRKPIEAAIESPAFGGALEIQLEADLIKMERPGKRPVKASMFPYKNNVCLQIRKHLYSPRLRRVFSDVLYKKENKRVLEMLEKVESYVTYGQNTLLNVLLVIPEMQPIELRCEGSFEGFIGIENYWPSLVSIVTGAGKSKVAQTSEYTITFSSGVRK